MILSGLLVENLTETCWQVPSNSSPINVLPEGMFNEFVVYVEPFFKVYVTTSPPLITKLGVNESVLISISVLNIHSIIAGGSS